jgi:drug/metabolite transporter (DMT)-like permease
VSSDVPLTWTLLPTRTLGVLFLAVPLLLSRRLHVARGALPFVVLAGLGEVVGFTAFVLGARHGIAITAVLASQFGVLAAVAGYVLFRERLTRPQLAGIAAIGVGVALLTWTQA